MPRGGGGGPAQVDAVKSHVDKHNKVYDAHMRD